MHIYRILIFITFNPDLLDLILHYMDELLVLPIELQSHLISKVLFLLSIQRGPMITT